MWEGIQKYNSVLLDPCSQRINDMVQRTLSEEVIPFDEWQDLVDDIDEELRNAPDVEAILQERGLTMPELERMAEADHRNFLDKLQRFGLPLNDRFTLCRKLCELARTAPSDELLRLYCDIVSDSGFLLDLERGESNGAVCWLYGKEDSDALYTYLSEQRELVSCWAQTLEQAKKIGPLNADRAIEEPSNLDEVFQRYCQLFGLSGNGTRFLDNLSRLLRMADRSEVLAPIKPLFLYRLLTRHGSRLQKVEDLQVDSGALWKYQHYQIEKHNGKNYKTNWKYLALFCYLCGVFKNDPQVKLPLCIYGFDQLSNLGDFCRACPGTEIEFLFPPSVEDLLDESMFSCFENGGEDNIILADSGFSYTKLERFRRSTNRRKVRALDRIAEYMNSHLDELIERFLAASQEDVRTLCAAILEDSALPAGEQPKDEDETVLFLAAINSGLMEAMDEIALAYLVQTGKYFLHLQG